jgi:HSP20 family molecular chaperone IbpA
MNDWTRFIEKWFNESQTTFTDYEFDLMKQELLVGFDELTEDFDRVFNDDLKELEFSESCTRIRSENVREEENIKVVSQLPIIDRRENIQVIAYSDNSVSISYLSPKGERSSRNLVLPYGIDIGTARSTYRNEILEITFNRK